MTGARSGSVPAVIAVRSLVLGAITVGLTGLAHAAAGGRLPAPVALATLMAVTAATAVPLLRRRLRPALLLPAMAATQAVLHPVFEGLADPAGHSGHGAPSLMLGAHAAAGVLAVLMVTTLDPALHAFGVRGARLPIRLGVVRVAPVRPALPPPERHDVAPTPRVTARPAPRRGPPARPATS